MVTALILQKKSAAMSSNDSEIPTPIEQQRGAIKNRFAIRLFLVLFLIVAIAIGLFFGIVAISIRPFH
jgi:hypothetical protein